MIVLSNAALSVASEAFLSGVAMHSEFCITLNRVKVVLAPNFKKVCMYVVDIFTCLVFLEHQDVVLSHTRRINNVSYDSNRRHFDVF